IESMPVKPDSPAIRVACNRALLTYRQVDRLRRLSTSCFQIVKRICAKYTGMVPTPAIVEKDDRVVVHGDNLQQVWSNNSARRATQGKPMSIPMLQGIAK